MTDDLRFDRLARDWLELGPVDAPADAVNAAFVEIRTMSQDRDRAAPWRFLPASRLALAATAIVLLAGGAALVPLVERVALPTDTGLRAASATITFAPTWPQDDRLAATIQGTAVGGGAYWRAATYDRLTPQGWQQSDARTVVRPAGSHVLEATFDDPGATPGTVTLTVTPAAGMTGPLLIAPGLPVTVDGPARITLLGPAGFFGGIARDGAADTSDYRIASGVATMGAGTDERIAAGLRAAGTDYPAAVAERYLQLDPGTLGPNATALRSRIVAEARSRAPFDLAQSAAAVLRSPAFTYSVDVRDVDCGAMSIAECFATSRRGYCLQYATTMAAILRDLGVPTRLVQGFRPGTVSGDVEVIRGRDAFAWVEVYFPGSGWVSFDPTGGSTPDQAPLP